MHNKSQLDRPAQGDVGAKVLCMSLSRFHGVCKELVQQHRVSSIAQSGEVR